MTAIVTSGYICQIAMFPVATSVPTITASAAGISCVMVARRRRSIWSVRTPANGETISWLMPRMKARTPSWNGELVSWRTSQLRVTSSIQLATCESAVPASNQRNCPEPSDENRSPRNSAKRSERPACGAGSVVWSSSMVWGTTLVERALRVSGQWTVGGRFVDLQTRCNGCRIVGVICLADSYARSVRNANSI